jgi:hypothetical protein
MTASVAIMLPGGYWVDGERHRDARLRPVGGSDTDFLFEEGDGLFTAVRVSALLGRCLERLGPPGPVSVGAVSQLSVGDREALLLHLRRLTFGDRLQGVVDCPDCEEKMDLDLRVSDLLLPPYDDCRQLYETEITDDGSAYRVSFRLPTGADQEETAILAHDSDQGTATETLLRRCVLEIDGGPGVTADELPPAVTEQLPETMSELDPQAEVLLSLSCPACGHDFLAPFDTAAYLFEELGSRSNRIYGEVHLLALYYHWSEADILAMSEGKRRRYLDLLEAALGGEA